MNKTVLITGTSSGIGSGLVDDFLSKGWDVVCLDKTASQKRAQDLKNFYQVDITNVQSLYEVAGILKSEGRTLSCIINNAAIQVESTLVETSFEDWKKVLDTNVTGVFNIVKVFEELVINGGSLINVSSVHAKATSCGLAAYATSKGAISALSRVMALEFAHRKIRVNSILPGAIDTEMLRSGLGRNASVEVALEKLVSATPIGRIGLPRDISQLALFLADEEKSSYITGQEFICDGGVLAGLPSE